MARYSAEQWLSGKEREAALGRLVDFDLVQVDPKGKIPLTGGGETDLYFDLRSARNNPDALEYVSELYAGALRACGVTRFVEIPHGVSCFAPLIATKLKMPYVTIRDTAKKGRGDKFKKFMIGRPFFEYERVAIVDDVITDGMSKIDPIRFCTAQGANVDDAIVLIDRDEGWREQWKRLHVDVRVWAGITMGQARAILGLPGGTYEPAGFTEM